MMYELILNPFAGDGMNMVSIGFYLVIAAMMIAAFVERRI